MFLLIETKWHQFSRFVLIVKSGLVKQLLFFQQCEKIQRMLSNILGPWLTSVFWLFSREKKSSSCDIDAWNSVNRILGQKKTRASAGRQLQLMTSHPPPCFLYTANMFFVVSHFPLYSCCKVYIWLPYTVQCRSYSKKTVNQFDNFSHY